MMRVWFVLGVLQCFSADAFYYPKIELSWRNISDRGKPLYLTPYVDSGDISKGRAFARVSFTDIYDIESYSGFFTVNKEYQSNQFFWYFPVLDTNKWEAPVIVWLQGGPGATSMIGLFFEHGPLRIQNNTFERRLHTWTQDHHVIYIDNPVGTGFSFTTSPKGYCTNEIQIGEELYSTVYQFLQLFPELQKNKFFVAGEGYGGKYASALAYTIHKKNPSAIVKINLKGIAIGNGLTDPRHQFLYGQYFYQIGLIDIKQKQLFDKREARFANFTMQKKWKKASNIYKKVLIGDGKGSRTFLYNKTGFNYTFNYLYTQDPNDITKDLGRILRNDEFRKSIHVGNLLFDNSEKVRQNLDNDIPQSVTSWVSELLDHYFVCVYNGQLDMIVPYPSTVNYLNSLKFNGRNEYKNSTRRIWRVDDEVAGYMKRGGKLMEVMVRDAGHMVPLDQPKWAEDLIFRFTHEVS